MFRLGERLAFDDAGHEPRERYGVTADVENASSSEDGIEEAPRSRTAATGIYRNWLLYMSTQKAAARSAGAVETGTTR